MLMGLGSLLSSVQSHLQREMTATEVLERQKEAEREMDWKILRESEMYAQKVLESATKTLLQGTPRTEGKKVIPAKLDSVGKLGVVIKAMKAKGGMEKKVISLLEEIHADYEALSLKMGVLKDEARKIKNEEQRRAATQRAGQPWRDAAMPKSLPEKNRIWKEARAGRAPQAISSSK